MWEYRTARTSGHDLSVAHSSASHWAFAFGSPRVLPQSYCSTQPFSPMNSGMPVATAAECASEKISWKDFHGCFCGL